MRASSRLIEAEIKREAKSPPTMPPKDESTEAKNGNARKRTNKSSPMRAMAQKRCSMKVDKDDKTVRPTNRKGAIDQKKLKSLILRTMTPFQMMSVYFRREKGDKTKGYFETTVYASHAFQELWFTLLTRNTVCRVHSSLVPSLNLDPMRSAMVSSNALRSNVWGRETSAAAANNTRKEIA